MIKKFLFQPVKPYYINQKFGENKVCINLTTNEVISKVPFLDSTPCPAGTKSVYSMMDGHNGIDLMAKTWQPVYAAQSGRVDEVCTELERGLGIGIRTLAPDGKWYRHRYWHLISINIQNGDELKTGDLIGYADSTGYSSGDHLHFELKEVDKDGRVLNKDNGYFGAIDPTPYMENTFALDFKGWWATLEKISIMLDKISDWLRYK